MITDLKFSFFILDSTRKSTYASSLTLTGFIWIVLWTTLLDCLLFLEVYLYIFDIIVIILLNLTVDILIRYSATIDLPLLRVE